MDPVEAQKLVRSWPHWHQRYEIFPGVVTPGVYGPDPIWERIQLPERLDGVSLLDIGACDGFFSREFHKRGAQVTALDYKSKNMTGFQIMESCYGHSFEHYHANIYEAPNHLKTKFDTVVCLGVLYHLPDMMKALAAIRNLCKKNLILETYVEEVPGVVDIALARYYQGSSLANDDTNFWAPNQACVLSMLADAGFVVTYIAAWGDRMLVQADVSQDPQSLVKLQKAYGLLDRGVVMQTC
jgi:tRNA (mo5U34)-methyltransferase